MKPIEEYAENKRCEMCGAEIIDGEPDAMPYYPAAEVVRRLAFIADDCPQLAILMMHRIAGRTEREIAGKLGITQQAVHGRLARAKKRMLSVLEP